MVKAMLVKGACFIILFVMATFAADYFPIRVGAHWKYNLYDTSGAVLCHDSQYIASDSFTAGKRLFKLDRISCLTSNHPNSNPLLYSDGDTVRLYIPSLNNPIRGLHKFHDGQIIYLPVLQRTDTIRYVGVITVLAGTFDSCYCWRTAQGAEYYAPNVGMIKTVKGCKTTSELSDYSR
jgi:hypothetical protein